MTAVVQDVDDVASVPELNMEKSVPKGADKHEERKDGKDAEKVNYLSILWPAYLCVFVDFLGLGISIPVLPFFTLELGWDSHAVCPSTCPEPDPVGETMCGRTPGCGSSIDVGAILGVFALGQMIGNQVMGRVSDRIGRKPVVMCSLLFSSLGYCWCGLAPNLTHLYLARTFSGIAGGTMPVAIAMVMDTVKDVKERPKYFGLCGAQIGLAFMVGPALGGALSSTLGNRAAFFAPTCVAVLVLLVAFFRVVETHPTIGKMDQSAGKIGTRDKASSNEANRLPLVVIICFGSMALGAFAFTSMTSMAGLIWLNLFNYGPTEIGIALSVVGLFGIWINVKGAKMLIHRVGTKYTMGIASFCLGVGVSSFTFVRSTVQTRDTLRVATCTVLSSCTVQVLYTESVPVRTSTRTRTSN